MNKTQDLINRQKEINKWVSKYPVRYVYSRSDGSQWMVLDTKGETIPELSGEFGDELPYTK